MQKLTLSTDTFARNISASCDVVGSNNTLGVICPRVQYPGGGACSAAVPVLQWPGDQEKCADLIITEECTGWQITSPGQS